jgi:hypothetical protein
MCVLVLSAAFFPETLFILRRNYQYIIIYVHSGGKQWQTTYNNNVHRSSCKTPAILHFSRQKFETYANTEFYENPSSGNRVFPWGQTDGTDRHDGSKQSLFAIFANAYNKSDAYSSVVPPNCDFLVFSLGIMRNLITWWQLLHYLLTDEIR